jgi:hypothetical protein
MSDPSGLIVVLSSARPTAVMHSTGRPLAAISRDVLGKSMLVLSLSPDLA